MPTQSFVFSAAAERALAQLACAAASPSRELIANVDAEELAGVWVTPPGSPAPDVDFDISNFADACAEAPVVISLAEALAASAEGVLDRACAASAGPLFAPVALQEAEACPRCCLDLVKRLSSGKTCIKCKSPPTPGSRTLLCEQCGAEVCAACIRHVAGDVTPPAGVVENAGEGIVPPLLLPAPAVIVAADVHQHAEAIPLDISQAAVVSLWCPGCSQPLRAVKCGGACAACSARVPRSTSAYRCRPCGGFLCSICAEGGAAEVAADPAVVPPRHAPEPDGDELSGPARLLASLRQLPEACLKQPVMFAPRNCRQQASDILHALLNDAVLRSNVGPGDVDAEIAHRLMRASGYILFRQPIDLAEEAECEGKQSTKLSKIIRDRLRLAADGQWQPLLDECTADNDKLAACTVAAGAAGFANNVQAAELSDATLQAAAVKCRHGSDKGACQILTGGPPVPPGPETDEKVNKLFRTAPLDAAGTEALEQALDRAASVRRRTWCGAKHASRCCARLRLASGPGPSGFRNSYIALIHSNANGPQALASWANVWGQASIASWLAELWTGALVRPFFKGNGIDVRPILCAEALLKFAVGVCIRTADRALANAVGERQFGGGRRGGVFQEVAEVRAATKLKPDEALLSLDVANAFGSVEWADALNAVSQRVPRLGPLLAIQWRAMQLRLWLKDAAGPGWHMLYVFGSLLQGGLDGHPVFCIVIGVVMMHVSKDGRVASIWAFIGVWIYVDDLLLQCAVQHVKVVIDAVVEVLATFKMGLQRRKCSIHIPALASVELDEWPAAARALEHILPLSAEGLVILGTDAAEDHALPLGPFAAATAKTRERADRACELSKAALQLIRRPPPAGGKHVAWRICRNVITHSLDFDSRVLSSSLVLPHAAAVERSAWDIVEAVIESELTDSQKVQVQLPTVMSGCQMPMPTLIVPLARAADIMETGHYIRSTITAWGYDLSVARSLDGADAAMADGLSAMLADRGIGFAAPGSPATLSSSAVASVEPAILRPAAPPNHMLSALLRVSSASRNSALLDGGERRDKIRLRSAAGPNAGKSLVAPAGLQAAHFSDDQISEVLRWRLGLANVEASSMCRNVAAKNEEECGEMKDQYGDHAVSCSYGPLRIKRHDDIADCLSDMIAETGAHVRREAYVRAMSTPSQEAWLDIWAFAGLRIQDLLVDVTIRHPTASAYARAAADHDGAAARAAEVDKGKRYPPQGGRRVVPFAMETWGRLGPEADALLESLAAEAARHAHRRGQATVASAFLRRWRATLDAALQKALAAALVSARCGLPGRAHRRFRP